MKGFGDEGGQPSAAALIGLPEGAKRSIRMPIR